MFGNLALTTLSFAALAASLPTGTPASSTSKRAIADQYIFYQGDGSSWPSTQSWGSFDELWNANVPLMRGSCGWNGWGADNSDAEINNIRNSIVSISSQTGVDNRFVLAIVMQETGGCVRAPTTNNGVINPGLMQSHNGGGSCAGINPCPASEIDEMIRDGTAGTSSGDGLRQTIDKSAAVVGGVSARTFYAAARMYNSGSVNWSDLNDPFTSTRCYAADVANRLTGWTFAARGCF